MRKKGQTAVEYLIILAVVIIIALIVVGVLGGIPGIGKGSGDKASKLFWSQAPVGIDNHAISAGGTDTVIVRNNLDTTITVETFSVNSVNVASNNVLGPEDQATLTGSIASCTAGDSYTYAVSMTYNESETGAGYTYDGNGRNLEGTCAS
ncbi:hypothetical protein CL617_03225 [archaeon]|nr:hypothetical protein [archaeon]|tara:strand:- start:1568 stop:2017 length:450 start_codon:yes stop_codon:yes gene_type:complete